MINFSALRTVEEVPDKKTFDDKEEVTFMWMVGLLCGAVVAVWHLDRQADQLFPSLLREAHFLRGLLAPQVL